jgi:hypothetical protein
MPVWLVAQHDPYKDVAAAAQRAFHEAFPATKRSVYTYTTPAQC